MPQSQPPAKSSVSVRIQPLRLSDTHRARAIFVDALLNHFEHFEPSYKQTVLAENSWWNMVKGVMHPRRILLVAKDGGRIIGYVIGSVPSGAHAQVYWLFVDPAYRGQNIGLALLSQILKRMRAKGARNATLVTHDHAKYYARQGFKLIERIPDGQAVKYVLSYPLEP